jgi:hypothetical protein
MGVKISRIWIYTVFFGVIFGAAAAIAQTAGGSTAAPPWGGSSAPAAPGVTPPPTGGGDSFFVPVQPPSEGFDYFDDEEEMGDGGGGGGGGTRREGKSSFKLLEQSHTPTCRKWGNTLLGTESYGDKTSCEFELEKRIDAGRASIDDLTDKIERFKLKKVIRGELKNRAETKKYDVQFTGLLKALDEASQSGCHCL